MVIEYRPRKIQRISGSLYVSLPYDWAVSLSLKAGMKIRYILNHDSTITIYPEVEKK